MKRVDGDEHGQKHCTGQYFDYWGCIDQCVSNSTFLYYILEAAYLLCRCRVILILVCARASLKEVELYEGSFSVSCFSLTIESCNGN